MGPAGVPLPQRFGHRKTSSEANWKEVSSKASSTISCCCWGILLPNLICVLHIPTDLNSKALQPSIAQFRFPTISDGPGGLWICSRIRYSGPQGVT
uniref:Uncharacterized protein n=3 Tax=environmental samples TaxID=68359 RepID=A0A075FVV7_9EURY|nr:hypothetical protein [uncultured marine group II/III euryarchaeote AD1000_57_E07]AIE95443.1 hypothetical protein [uncultured marine group II/III euryarchaeote AD1000_66_B03]AIE96882.1 hypothetical protein [uncultured marine group II/III euryarchaeote AD1000_88_C03]